MTLPDFYDRRPYTHPDHPGTWRISVIAPSTIIMKRKVPNSPIEQSCDVSISDWPGEWQATETTTAAHTLDTEYGAELVMPGIYLLTDEHHVYAVPSTSTDRIHTVTVNTRTGAMRCDGPHCDARTCDHQRRVLAARAGF
jgi:hypothetical protein